jgi:hypothetical protein
MIYRCASNAKMSGGNIVNIIRTPRVCSAPAMITGMGMAFLVVSARPKRNSFQLISLAPLRNAEAQGNPVSLW